MMKKATSAVLVLAALAFAVPAMAATFWSETFTYPDGDLTTVSGGLWVAHSGIGSLPPQVISGQAVLTHGSGSREDDNRSFTARGATDKTYACFKCIVGGTSPVTDVYFAHFKDSGTFNFGGRVFATTSGSSFTFGLSATSSTIAATWPTALNFGQQYTVVVMYDAAAGSAQLWVDPVSEASASISAAGGTAGFLLEGFALRQSGGNTTQQIDDLTVGETFGDVCQGATPTTATSWGRVKALYR